MTDALDLLVDKANWRQHRFAEGPSPELAEGQVLFRVDRFAITANNISYAAAGDMLGYWRFFPAPDGWGRIPVMGFGDVVASRHPQVEEGTRCFGFYPMSRHLVIEPGVVSASQILDGAAHRDGLAPAYNQYVPVDADAFYEAEHEDAMMLLRGLFMTSFLADDALAEHDHYGASAVLISSASSKTSIALGHQVSQGARARAIGLTSERNLDFVRKLGCYDEVVTYDAVTSLDADLPCVFVDMAGSASLRHAIHGHFGALGHSMGIGLTHWEEPPNDAPLPGPKPEFFFAPGQIQKRIADWGADGFQERIADAWRSFRAFSGSWLEVKRGHGRDALVAAYEDTLEGRSSPAHGLVRSLQDDA